MLCHCARRPCAIVFVALLIVGTLSGCSGGTPLQRAGVERLDVPEGWTATSVETWPVPGSPLAAWKGPDGWSFVVYRELSAVGNDAPSIVQRTRNRFENFPGLTVVSAGEVEFSKPAARVEATAPGTGASWFPTGTGVPLGASGATSVPTRRVLISVPLNRETVSFLWHAPEADAEALLKQVEQFRPTLRASRRDNQSY